MSQLQRALVGGIRRVQSLVQEIALDFNVFHATIPDVASVGEQSRGESLSILIRETAWVARVRDMSKRLKDRLNFWRFVVPILTMLIVTIVFLVFELQFKMGKSIGGPLVLIGWLVLMVCAIQVRRMKCPRCKTPLMPRMGNPLGSGTRPLSHYFFCPDQCPRCGEPW